jgi:PTS system nitrogen regulatory IIA component
MNLKKALHRDAVTLRMKSTSKAEVIEELVDLLVAADLISDREAACAAVTEREGKMSTGMQFGIAIPHGKTDTISSLVAAVGIHSQGLDFDAIDHQPCTIFILTLSPIDRTGPHIQFLAEISRLLNESQIRDQILNAASPDEVVALLTS